MDAVDAVDEMVKDGLLTHEEGNNYKWYEASSPRSCEVKGDGALLIFSDTMQAASPGNETPVSAHRFYLYHLANLDLSDAADQLRCREYLFDAGYGSAPTPRYATDTAHTHGTSDTDTEQDANENAVTQWLRNTEKAKGKHHLILGSAAGTGKTTACILHADHLLYIGKTTDEADDVFYKMVKQGDDAGRHRPRMFQRHSDDWETLPIGLGANEHPCPPPEMCNLHIQRIGTPDPVCSRCTVFEICKEYGYRSQAKRERNAAKVVDAWGESVACDEMLRGHIKRLCKKDDVLIVDEVNPLILHQHRHITRDQVFDLVQRFQHPDTADICQTLHALHDIIGTSNTDPKRFFCPSRRGSTT